MSVLNLAFLVCFCCLSLSLASASQNCHPNDLSVLNEFAGQLINGSVKLSWSNVSSCCEWEGVACENGGNKSTANRVIMVNLSGKGLKGKFPESLCKLDQLIFLDLSHNFLEGELPLEISNLNQLEVLDFSHNMLIGPAIGAVTGLNSIRSLNLSGNSFTGNFSDFGVFPYLVALNISSNLFTGQLSSQNCSFFKRIRVLDLSSNHFTGGLEGLYNCTTFLQQLHLDFNSFSGDLPESLYSISSLELLSISANNFSGQISPKIKQFVAHSNSFSGPIPSTLALCSKLRALDLRNNSFSGPIDLDFSGFHNLCTLDLGSNHFSGHLPVSLSACQELKIVSLAKNNLSGQIPQNYANLSSLIFLSLSNNSLVNLSGSLSVLRNCRNLTTLILTKNFHGEEIPQNVSGFENLLLFALGNCGLKGRIPNWLLNCRKLQVLDLSWNHLEGSIPSWIGQMEGLFYLDFSNNSLTGEIPKGLTELKGLISASICSSSLNTSTGIPLFVKRNQSASGLQYNQASTSCIGLKSNNITGTIPSSISNMVNLETLDLSYNDLHGSIPSSFNHLTFLSKFSVANNHLDGAIPTGGQFLSFPSSSFEGNPGLCGKLISPCLVNNVGLHHSPPSRAYGKLGRKSILGITISIGIGIALILAVLLLRISRKDNRIPIEDADELGRAPRFSDAFGPPTLVLFKNADCKDILTVSDLLKSTNNFNQSNIVGWNANFKPKSLSPERSTKTSSLQGYCRYGNDRLLIYSYMENGSLDYWLHERVDGSSSLTWGTRLKIAQGAARGLAYLHREPNIVHRDVKTSNILLDEKFDAHLADFGLSRLLHPYDTHVTTDLVGTLGYIPPEYSQTLTATFRGDVYSFGVVLLELLTGRRPVEVCKGKNCRDLVAWVYQKKLEKKEEEIFDSSIRDKNCEKELMEVLGIACKCIDKDPRRRPSIDEVVSLLDAIGIEKA
ncbi:hypothetical protein DH2020_031678 [Rehmannia glutinosa]|uniref:Protein kinase domain-containing protein n=1 Tax=Rehmannia glutinosa TaxID=99300 RepID=A0ABR0VKV1_REHGL